MPASGVARDSRSNIQILLLSESLLIGSVVIAVPSMDRFFLAGYSSSMYSRVS